MSPAATARPHPERRRLPAALLLAAAAGGALAAPAEATHPGRLRLGVEVEHERAAGGHGHADSLTLVPGIKWERGWLTMAEILLQVEREVDDGGTRSERKLGIRLRRDIALAPDLRLSLRGLLGRAFAAEGSFSYAYVEPALKYRLQALEWTAGVRVVRSLDGTKGHDRNKFRLGPSFDLGSHDEIEFRWVRSWDAHSGKRESDAGIVEYIRKF